MATRFINLIILTALLTISVAHAESSDPRHRRDQNGMHLEVPAKVQRNTSFPISLDAGTRIITRIAFFTQGGYWNQHFPSYYKAEDAGVSVSGVSIRRNYSSEFDYYRWEVKNYNSSDSKFNATIRESGRVLLYVWLKRRDGVESMEQFIIDVY
jgi:hypothetical protein